MSYYAVERSSEYLAHYGVKGMKWGVRKARESGNNVRLAYHYARAKLKLAKLKLNSNWYIHQKRGDILDKIANNKHRSVRIAGHLTGAGIRSKIQYLKASTPGDLYNDNKYEKFKKEMNKTFRGTKYDPRMKGLNKARKKKLKKKLGIK